MFVDIIKVFIFL